MPDNARKAADALMDKHSPKPTFSSAPECTEARRDAFRDDIASALTKAHARGQAEMREAAAANLRKWLSRNRTSLHVGEMTAQEWRTARVVIGALVLETSALPISSPAPDDPEHPHDEA